MTMKHTSRRPVVWLLATAALLALVSCEPAVISGGRLVESITISAAGGPAEISAEGGTLQLIAEVLPSSAANKSLRWSVISGSLYANVSETGLVTALGNGTATIRARAQDGSGVYGDIEVDISDQPVDGTLRFNLESSELISETQPAYYIISVSETFSGNQTMAYKVMVGGDVSQDLPPGNYYLRAFHDLNNNGSLDAEEPFTAAVDFRGGPQPIFSPMEIIIGSGEDVVIDLDTLPVLGSTDSWAWPANPGTLRVSLGYTGELGPVNETKRLFLGISENSDLTDRDGYIADIGIEKNNRIVLAILSEGNYYMSSFFDAGGIVEDGPPIPSAGDPAQVYKSKPFAPGGEEPYAHEERIMIGQINLATINLDDTIKYSPD